MVRRQIENSFAKLKGRVNLYKEATALCEGAATRKSGSANGFVPS